MGRESGFGSNVRFLLLVQAVREQRSEKEGLFQGSLGEGGGLLRGFRAMSLSLHGMIVCGR